MKQLDGDHDQRLLGRFALGLLTEINGAPLATTANGIDGGEVERMARNARAHGRQVGSRRAVAALVDDRVKADIRDERPRIGEAGERAEFAEQGGGRLSAERGRGRPWRRSARIRGRPHPRPPGGSPGDWRAPGAAPWGTARGYRAP